MEELLEKFEFQKCGVAFVSLFGDEDVNRITNIFSRNIF